MITGQFADRPTHCQSSNGLVNSRTSQVADSEFLKITEFSVGLVTTLDCIGKHVTASEFHSLPHWTKSNHVEHFQYHIGPPK